MPKGKGNIFSYGFTLIELLIVVGIVAILLSITLVALNPYESLNRTNDLSAKAIANDFVTSSIEYLATTKELPWDKDPLCQTQLDNGQTLSDMPACTHDLINDGKLEVQYNNSSQLKEIYFSKCGKSAVLCYNPKSKIEYSQNDAVYNKFGVNQPGCPGKSGPSPDCYWCKPVLNDPQCLISPTPTLVPTATPTVIPTPTPTPLPSPTPTIASCPYKIGAYCLDDTKFFQTYAVVAFSDPGFPAYTTTPDADGGVNSGWMIDVSFRPDFGGTISVDGFGYYVNGVAATTGADTVLWVTGGGNFYADWASDTVKNYQRNLTTKHFGFISMPFEWSTYVNGCGKTIYWRVVNFRTGIPGVNYDSNEFSPTYSSTIDCSTKVGVIGTTYDINNDGVVDYTDYIILALQTKLRYGGWYPPE